MPKYVLNKETRQLHDVPEGHWSLTGAEYMVFDKKPGKAALDKCLRSLGGADADGGEAVLSNQSDGG